MNHSLIPKIQFTEVNNIFKITNLIRFNNTKFFLRNTKNTDTSRVNEQKIHEHHAQRERDNIRKG